LIAGSCQYRFAAAFLFADTSVRGFAAAFAELAMRGFAATFAKLAMRLCRYLCETSDAALPLPLRN
jgi:hypothetical protein